MEKTQERTEGPARAARAITGGEYHTGHCLVTLSRIEDIIRKEADWDAMLEVLEGVAEDCRMALDGSWDKGDEGFQCTLDSVNACIAKARGGETC